MPAISAAIFGSMLRVVLGLLKGAVVGGAIGWGAFKLGVTAGVAAILTYAVIGGLAGMICGKPPWRQDTLWTSALKGLFGVGVGIGLYLLGRKVLGMHITLPAALGAPGEHAIADLPIVLGPLIGAVWGCFVEVDDGGSAKAAADKSKSKPA